MNSRIIWTAVLSAVAVLLLAGTGVLAWMYSGEYNVAASKPHTPLGRWALETVMRKSVQDHAAGVQVPPLTDSALVATGFHHFQEMCVTCHGAPGEERSEIGEGLTPTPPELSEAVPEWTDAELFWIVKHGIKMSGMPAFGETHSDGELWGIVAFLQRLPALSPAEYQTLKQAYVDAGGAGGGDHGGGGSQGGHGGPGHSH
jgi:mono/diheme cytochrome c family protein